MDKIQLGSQGFSLTYLNFDFLLFTELFHSFETLFGVFHSEELKRERPNSTSDGQKVLKSVFFGCR